MWPDRVSNPGPLTYESGALPTALHGPTAIQPGQLVYDLNFHPSSDSIARGPGLDTRFGHILLFLLPLIEERQLSVTVESMCMKYWLTA